MDKENLQREQQLTTLKKQETDLENQLSQIRQQQNQLARLEEDNQGIAQEQYEMMDMLRQGWQGERANGYHSYLEDLQQQEARTWRNEMIASIDAADQEAQKIKNKQWQLQDQQAQIRKEMCR
ncbi:ribonuclease P [Listeria ilorinensis]|uniref:ribonuclease P n=1 Tax=Listeria ilorinensis TaxID=2867439 RepID=UPI001EF4EB5D|nr:ribonuclease P [Listeria ilorinensis]